MPAATLRLQKEDPTIAELLKNHGYATGQFGKNHLGDRNEYLPTVYGFDEFFGNLYHLNAEEDPESRTYPRDPKFRETFGPRGVLRCKATDNDGPTVQPRWGRIGKQTIEDTGALTKKRMETIDDETSDAAVDYIKRQAQAGKPFFCWYNSTRMHLRTHVAPERRSPPGLTARTEYADGMVEHDGHVGKVLKAVDDLGIADNTIVLYTTDNGPHMNTWPDGAMTPFRREGHDLGGGVPGSVHDSLAGQDHGRQCVERDRQRARLDSDVPGCRRRARHQGEVVERARGSRQYVQSPP
jgi:arylsulfatase A-like enzyme